MVYWNMGDHVLPLGKGLHTFFFVYEIRYMIILYDCLGRFKMTQHVCLHLNASGELDLSHISGSHDHDDD